MRVLVVHNQLWAHYKSVLFEEIQRVFEEQHPDSEFLVAQIALYEKSRESMLDEDSSTTYRYSYRLLFERSLDTVTFRERLVALFRLFHAYRPDVLNITGYFDYAQVLLLLYAKLRGVKTVLSSESSAVDKSRTGHKELIKKTILKQVDAFFCFGTSSVQYLLALGVKAQKIAVEKAAVVDSRKIEEIFLREQPALESQRPRAFIYVGRLAPEKNLLLLIQAYEELQKKHENTGWQLILVGNGPDKTRLQEYMTSHALSGITLTGGVGWTEVPRWLARASVLVLPSLSEPWGLVVNEAMICQMPVIVSSKCGCVDDLVVSGKNGFVIDPYQSDSLLNAMQYYIESPEVIQKEGEYSKKIIEPFAPEAVARQMVQAYYQLLQKTH